MAEIRVPSLGQSVPEAMVNKWLVKEGDSVAPDQAVVELETDKITMEVTAFKGGTLFEIRKKEGETVQVGDVLGIIAEAGETPAREGEPEPAEKPAAEKPAAEVAEEEVPAAEAPAPETGAPPAEQPAAPAEAPAKPAEAPATQAPPQPASAAEAVIPEDAKSSPAVRKLAREHKLDLTKIQGTGKDGRVTRDDVLSYIESRGTAAPTPTSAAPAPAAAAPARVYGPDEPIERARMSPIRKTIARRMTESKHTAAHVTTVDECDMWELVALRERMKEDFLAKHGVKLTYMPFIAKAVVAALKEHPEANASIEGDEIVYHKFYHFGIAVHTDAGLVVPVIRHIDQKSIVQIAKEIDDLAKRARERKLELPEIQGSTFTLTNAGGYGAVLSTPIINVPDSAILGIHKITERPIARSGQVVIRPMMWFGLSYDHRLVDGAPAVMFLRRVCELLESPERLLIEA